MSAPSDEIKDLAWLGDAVLALFAREWLMRRPEHPQFTRQDLFLRLTTNRFLSTVGEPTSVEANIGDIYRRKGLEAAYAHIEEVLIPRFNKHLRNAEKGRKGSHR
jgi:dsRNA-specific ribonuclease